MAAVRSEPACCFSLCGGRLSAALRPLLCVLPDVDECLATGDAAVCKNGAACANTAGGFDCTCTPGWSGDFCDTGGSCCGGFVL